MNIIELSVVCFGGGGNYAPTPPPDVPTDDSPEVKRAAEEAAKKERDLARNVRPELHDPDKRPRGIRGTYNEVWAVDGQ